MPWGKGLSGLHGVDRLTGRQSQVVDLLRQGLGQEEIAKQLGIKEGTLQNTINSAKKTVVGAGQDWESLIRPSVERD